jgi:hypothetical protein
MKDTQNEIWFKTQKLKTQKALLLQKKKILRVLLHRQLMDLSCSLTMEAALETVKLCALTKDLLSSTCISSF